MLRSFLVLAAVTLPPLAAQAQESTGQRQRSPDSPAADRPPAPRINLIRWQEDWSDLSGKPREALSPYERTKFVPLGSSSQAYVTFGGDVRLRMEAYDEPNYGLLPPDAESFASVAVRTLAHADVHVGPQFRAFLQVGAWTESGREPGPRPVDEGEPDLAQGFVDLYSSARSNERWGVRLGRQQIVFGSARLFSSREGPNIQRSFDAVRLGWTGADGSRADAFFARPVAPDPDAFNDQSSKVEETYGVYLTRALRPGGALGLDLYAIGRERERAVFAQGGAREERGTIGTRVFGTSAPLDFNVEAAYQFGSFGAADIRAWGAAADVGYTLQEVRFSPRLGLKLDVASGDDDPGEPELGTFDALYPAFDYFSTAAAFSPTNGIDLQPSLKLNWTPRLSTTFGVDLFWRLSKDDGFYSAAGPLLVRPGQSDAAYTTALYNFDVVWRLSEHVDVRGALVAAQAGEVLQDAGGRDQLFGLAQIGLRF